MSILQNFKETQALLEKMQTQLKQLEESGDLQRELAFEQKLRALMDEYGVNLGTIVTLLDPESVKHAREASADKSMKQRRPRTITLYRNPHSNEELRTKGGNSAVLKAWKQQYGADAVRGWRVTE